MSKERISQSVENKDVTIGIMERVATGTAAAALALSLSACSSGESNNTPDSNTAPTSTGEASPGVKESPSATPEVPEDTAENLELSYSLPAETLKTPEDVITNYMKLIDKWTNDTSSLEPCGEVLLAHDESSSTTLQEDITASGCTTIENGLYAEGIYGEDWQSNGDVKEMAESYVYEHDSVMSMLFYSSDYDTPYRRWSEITQHDVIDESEDEMTIGLELAFHDNMDTVNLPDKYDKSSVEGNTGLGQVTFERQDDNWIVTKDVVSRDLK